MNYQKGGQRRTIETGCGWRCVGHPNEVNGKYKIHKKFCDTCKDSITELPSFNKDAGKINGWKGIKNKHQQPNQMLTTAFVDGERNDIFLTGVTNIEMAMDDAKLTASLIAENLIPNHTAPITKSQKKRMKKLNKKINQGNEKFEEIITDAMLKHIPNEQMDKFLDKYDAENIDEDEAVWELAELITGNMTDEEVNKMLCSYFKK